MSGQVWSNLANVGPKLFTFGPTLAKFKSNFVDPGKMLVEVIPICSTPNQHRPISAQIWSVPGKCRCFPISGGMRPDIDKHRPGVCQNRPGFCQLHAIATGFGPTRATICLDSKTRSGTLIRQHSATICNVAVL